LRKKGLKIYVSNWASNDKNIFIISNKSHRNFDIVVDDDSTTSKRDLKLVPNGTFLDQAIKLNLVKKIKHHKGLDNEQECYKNKRRFY